MVQQEIKMNSIIVWQAWKAKFRRRWSEQEVNRKSKPRRRMAGCVWFRSSGKEGMEKVRMKIVGLLNTFFVEPCCLRECI